MQFEGYTPHKKEDAERYTKYRWWAGLTMGDLLDRASDIYPDKEALVDHRIRLTYGQLRQEVDRLAIGLIKLGVKRGDYALLQLPNWAEWVYSYFALQKIGAVVVLLVAEYTRRELNHFARLTGATTWIVPEKYRKTEYRSIIGDVTKVNPALKHVVVARAEDSGQLATLDKLIEGSEPTKEKLRQLANRRAEPTDLCNILPTGGTTGLPKAAPRTHNDYICGLEYKARACDRCQHDVCLTMTPVGHNVALQITTCGTIFTFGKMVLLDSTRPQDICEIIQREKVTFAALVPALLTRLVNFEGLKNYDLSSLKKLHIGAQHSPPELIKNAYETIGVPEIISAFGMVEGPNCNTRLDDSREINLTTVGRPCCPYDEFKVIDAEGNDLGRNKDGELAAKGPSIFTGYLKADNSKVLTEDGYIRTGDLAIIDDRGNVKITGRTKDIIIRGGENISPIEIEELIIQHPDVEDVAVVGMPDEELGERVYAYIQPKAGKKPSFDDVISFLKSQGASKLLLPESIGLIDRLPLTQAGKSDKKALREDLKRRLQQNPRCV